MKKLIFLFLIFISTNLFAQININYSFIPAKNEFDSSIGYIFNNKLEFGLLYSKNKSEIFKINPESIYYIYSNIKLNNNFNLYFAYGNGFERDIEISINYQLIKKINQLELTFGISKTDYIILEIKYLINI